MGLIDDQHRGDDAKGSARRCLNCSRKDGQLMDKYQHNHFEKAPDHGANLPIRCVDGR